MKPQPKGKPMSNEMNQTTETQQATTLYYKEGSSDKVYQCAVEGKDDAYSVTFAFGRRGYTLQTGSKTPTSVPLEAALNIYNKLVKEKLAKGYTPGADGTPYHHTDQEAKATGILPQLLNPIEQPEVQRYLDDPDYCMQEKLDGKRILIEKTGTDITGINRKGLAIGLPETIHQSAQNIAADFIIDGESIGDDFFAFDILALNSEDVRSIPYYKRWNSLCQLLNSNSAQHIHWVDAVFSKASKLELYEYLQAVKAEGVVFKRRSSPYTPDRPASGGDQFKYKFYATLSAVVSKINDKRSVELQLLDQSKGWVTAGNVTIPANQSIPEVNAVVEIRYLYAFRESGCLYQPVFLGGRTDVDSNDCTVSQLKYKPAEES